MMKYYTKYYYIVENYRYNDNKICNSKYKTNYTDINFLPCIKIIKLYSYLHFFFFLSI